MHIIDFKGSNISHLLNLGAKSAEIIKDNNFAYIYVKTYIHVKNFDNKNVSDQMKMTYRNLPVVNITPYKQYNRKSKRNQMLFLYEFYGNFFLNFLFKKTSDIYL